MTTSSTKPSLLQLRWFRTCVITLALFFGVLFVLPLLYELFVIATPAMDPATERASRGTVQATSNIFSWVILVMGLLLAWRQRQNQLRREYVHKRVLERRRERRQEMLQAQREKLYGKKSKTKRGS